MKIIHTADLHLDCAASRISNKKEYIKESMYNSFKNMVDYATKNYIEHILISGDLFDTPYPSNTILENVLYIVKSNPKISFYYLRGNHDRNLEIKSIPENLKLFSSHFKTYELENITISGIELNGEINYKEMEFDQSKINILLMHGDIDNPQDSDYIDKNQLINKPLNYIALGHIHKTYSKEISHIIINNPGILEPHGFDELGKKGFFVLDINEDNKSIKTTFINQNINEFVRDDLNIEGMSSQEEIINSIKTKYQNNNCFLELSLTGQSNTLNSTILSHIKKEFKDSFQYFEITDNTEKIFNKDEYLNRNDIIGESIKIIFQKDKDPKYLKKLASETVRILQGGKIDD